MLPCDHDASMVIFQQVRLFNIKTNFYLEINGEFENVLSIEIS